MRTISADEERGVKNSLNKAAPAEAKNSYGSVPNIDNYGEEQTDEVSYQHHDSVVSSTTSSTKILYSWKSGVVLAAVGVAAVSLAIFSPSSASSSTWWSYGNVSNKGLIPSPRNMDIVASVNMTALALDGFTYGASSNATYSISTMGVVTTEVGFTTIGDGCVTQKDCSDGTYCNTHELALAFPAQKFCYECLNSNHCPDGKKCLIDQSNAECVEHDVDPLPSIASVTRGYNIFDADPLLTKPDALFDDGFSRRSFYSHTYSTSSSNRRLSLGGKTFYIPVGFDAYTQASSVSTARTTSFTSTNSFQSTVETSVSVGGSGVIEDLELGGKVGASAYKSIQEDASMDKMTTESKAFFSLYRFEMNSIDSVDLKLTDQADAMLSGMTDTSDSWAAFFEEYGTHIITGGTMGAFERFSESFTSEQREFITSDGSSFETEVSAGMPFLFSFSNENAIEHSRTVGERIKEVIKTATVVRFGSQNPPDNLIDSPGVIRMNLESICLFIDDKKYTNIKQRTCLESIKDYCSSKLNTLGLGKGGGSCEYADSKTFQCFTDENCNPSQRCDANQCVKRDCFVRSDCPRPEWEHCTERGVCVRSIATDSPLFCTILRGDLIDTHWTSCTWGPSCKSGYVLDRYENGPCTFGTERKVCVKYSVYIGPPCRKYPLRGNCGSGKRGNGCCANGGYCSKYGWCGWNGGFSSTMKNPSRNQCKQMTGR